VAYSESQRRGETRQNSQRPEKWPTTGGYVPDTHEQSQRRPPIARSECDFWEFEPRVGRVANGVSARVGKLRAFGNAIVPKVAAEFIKAFMECRP